MSTREAWLNGEVWTTWRGLQVLFPDLPMHDPAFFVALLDFGVRLEKRANTEESHCVIEYRCIARADLEAYLETMRVRLGRALLEKL